MKNFMLNLLKNFHSKKSNVVEAGQTLNILNAAISSHLISFRFLQMFGNFRTSQENKLRLIGSTKISCSRGKNFAIISRDNVLLISLYMKKEAFERNFRLFQRCLLGLLSKNP